MNKKSTIIIGAVAAALIGVLGLTLFLLQSQQDVRSRADNTTIPTTIPTSAPGGDSTSTAQTCALPAQVQNVKIDFPNCVGDQCNFTQASCSWTSLAGATKYQLTITQVDDGTTIANEQLEGSVTSKTFDVKDGFTYKCDVAAVNSCGTAGAAGSHTLLCKVDAAVDEPTPTTPPTQVACGSPCTDSSACQAGYVCAIGASGQGNCALPAAASACQASPSVSSCCSVATVPPSTPAPTVPPTGELSTTVTMGAGALVLVIVGMLLFAL